MRRVVMVLVVLGVMGCGFPPFPPYGCEYICVDGVWHLVCK